MKPQCLPERFPRTYCVVLRAPRRSVLDLVGVVALANVGGALRRRALWLAVNMYSYNAAMLSSVCTNPHSTTMLKLCSKIPLVSFRVLGGGLPSLLPPPLAPAPALPALLRSLVLWYFLGTTPAHHKRGARSQPDELLVKSLDIL